MFKRTAAPFAAGAIFAVLVGTGTAYAATGGNFHLGKSNTAKKTTTITAKRGPALSLNSKKGPALKVNSKSRVARLNADLLDGLSSASFARSTARTGSYDSNGVAVDLDENGYNDTIAGVAQCPRGSWATGGGGGDLSSTGYLVFNSPTENGRGWLFAVGITEGSSDGDGDAFASVVCWNAKGKPAGSYRSGSVKDLSSGDLKMLTRASAARR
jgi:hypothetical protein